MFNDVAGLDLFFSNTHEKHTLPVMRSVCWSTELQRVVPLPDQSGETFEDRKKKQLGCDHTKNARHPLLSINSAAFALAFLQRSLEATENGRTERASKDWK